MGYENSVHISFLFSPFNANLYVEYVGNAQFIFKSRFFIHPIHLYSVCVLIMYQTYVIWFDMSPLFPTFWSKQLVQKLKIIFCKAIVKTFLRNTKNVKLIAQPSQSYESRQILIISKASWQPWMLIKRNSIFTDSYKVSTHFL